MTKKVNDYDPDFDRIARNMENRGDFVDFNAYQTEFKSYFQGKLKEGDPDYEMLLEGSARAYGTITDRLNINNEIKAEKTRNTQIRKKKGLIDRSLEYIGIDREGRTLLVSREVTKNKKVKFRDKNGRFASPKE